jgi:predicted signal transduction protein with EAL and GGDEF domain
LLAISVGAAFHPGDGNDAESLLAEADRRMYVTKQGHKAKNQPPVADSLLALQNALVPEPPQMTAPEPLG